MKVSEVLRLLQQDGWRLAVTRRGSEARMRYAIVIERAEGNYSAYVPVLPGCAATGATVAEVESEIREAIEFHIEGMREDGLPVPAASSRVEYMEVAAEGTFGTFGGETGPSDAGKRD